MGGIDILFILAVMSFGSVGMLFIFYWPYRLAMNALAQGPLMGKPLALFTTAFLGAVVWCGAIWAGMVTAFEIKNAFGVWMFVLLGAAGTVGWLIMLVAWLAGRKRAVQSEKPPPPPKLQVWAQDLVVAMLCYGAGLALLAQYFGQNRSHMDDFLCWAVYLFIAGSFGLFVAADLCRRTETGQKPAARAGIFVAIFTLFPATLPLALLAWIRWRRGMKRAGA
jgi:ABC-type Na+ efflux pump permease subunit